MSGDRSTTYITMALAARLAVLIVAVIVLITLPVREGYLLRFVEIAEAPGRPYTRFALEYPPLLFWVIELVAWAGVRQTALTVVGLSLLLDLGTAALLFKGWGRSAAAAYLVLGTPLLAFLYLGLDLVPVAVAVAGAYFLCRSRPIASGIVLSAAVFTKIWPIVLLPFVRLSHRRAFIAAVVTLALGTIAWIGWSGVQGLRQVATQRDTPGWEVESTVGAVTWTVTAGPVEIVNDSPRVGTAPMWAKAALGLTALGWITAIWLRSRDQLRGTFGKPVCAAVAALLSCSPVFSYPFVVYLIPWAAIAASTGDRHTPRLAFVAALLTGIAHAAYGAALPVTRPGVVQALLIARNVAVVAIGILPLAAIIPSRLDPRRPTD